jgi:Na+/H+ antiporter NhaD/arsenite permease-like protein
MAEYIARLNKKILYPGFNLFKKDIVFTISFMLAAVSCFIYTPKLEYIDFKVLFSLFNLMLVVKALEELKILDKFAVSIVNRCSNSRQISLVLISLCFFSSMFITNDVALITFVPLTLIISRKTQVLMLDTIIFQTLAANIGSCLTPMGNPQNLYIFSFYKLTVVQFFTTVGLLVILGGIWLYILNNRLKTSSIDVELPFIKIENKKEAIAWGIVFCIIAASILGVINYKLAFIITIFTVLIFNKSLLVKIDYLLLVTFVCFFIFIGNLSNIDFIHSYMGGHLKSTNSVYFSSIVFSQFISNVPAAILLSKFTDNWKPLLLGVNLGGMGTIIASLASVISYKLFIEDNQQNSKTYMVRFSIYSFVSLILLSAISYIMVKV